MTIQSTNTLPHLISHQFRLTKCPITSIRTASRAMFSSVPGVPIAPATTIELLHQDPTPKQEDEFFDRQVKELTQLWDSPRWVGVKRPYTARQVASKQGTLKQLYPSSQQAKKLWSLIQQRGAQGKPIHTMGVIDPVQMSQMAFNQEVVYISGWACSSTLTSTNEVSPDLGDYPYNTVPNQVQRIFKAQQLHDRKHWDARRLMSPEERARVPYIDYLRPIIADGDTGHGGLSSVMKLAKLFAESGAAGIHLEDQMHGGKKCGHLSGKVLVPVGEHVNRLIATRFQWDLMGCENLIIARTDSESGKLISSSVDVRDHEFIMGITDENAKPLAEVLFELERKGASAEEINKVEKEWLDKHKLVTYDEVVLNILLQQPKAVELVETWKRYSPHCSITDARKMAAELLGDKAPFFSWDIPRTREGFYHYKAGIPAATKRILEFAPYSDLLWLETKRPDVKQATGFAGDIRNKLVQAYGAEGGKYFIYNLSPSFNWLSEGYSEQELKDFIWKLAEAGFILQLVSLAGIHSGAAVTCKLSEAFKKDGMLAYVNLIQMREKESGTDVLTHQKWSGANYLDGIIQTIQSGSSGTSAVGSDSTEHSF